ncbi:Uncharacterised protein [Halioglobus japonicus]|nr:Uncharacterised protein [Halioglobus japonicus]
MQNRITQRGDLLDENGVLKHAGWAKSLLLDYDRAAIRASKFKIKEWDYYCILTERHGVAFTIADNSYMSLIAVTVFDFDNAREISNSVMLPFTMGSLHMPSSSESGDILFENKKVSLKFLRQKESRKIEIDYVDFCDKKRLTGSIVLQQPDALESMVIATPFPKNKLAFYYNQKINCMPAQGELRFGDKTLSFSPDTSFAVLDWGRGVWTYSNTWYWGSASGEINGKSFGFNIGYGFGDTSKASENMLFHEGKAHKIDRVEFHIPEDDFLKPWKFSSNDARFEMDFTPIIDRHSNANLVLIKSTQHQVFGRFSGRAQLDSGEDIIVKDLLGFAEKVYNRW